MKKIFLFLIILSFLNVPNLYTCGVFSYLFNKCFGSDQSPTLNQLQQRIVEEVKEERDRLIKEHEEGNITETELKNELMTIFAQCIFCGLPADTLKELFPFITMKTIARGELKEKNE